MIVKSTRMEFSFTSVLYVGKFHTSASRVCALACFALFHRCFVVAAGCCFFEDQGWTRRAQKKSEWERKLFPSFSSVYFAKKNNSQLQTRFLTNTFCNAFDQSDIFGRKKCENYLCILVELGLTLSLVSCQTLSGVDDSESGPVLACFKRLLHRQQQMKESQLKGAATIERFQTLSRLSTSSPPTLLTLKIYGLRFKFCDAVRWAWKKNKL